MFTKTAYIKLPKTGMRSAATDLYSAQQVNSAADLMPLRLLNEGK